MATDDEAQILLTNNVLLVLSKLNDASLAESFCGSVYFVDERTDPLPVLFQKTIYLCGEISKIHSLGIDLGQAKRILVVENLSHLNDQPIENESIDFEVVDLGRVPILIHEVGVYFRRFFDLGSDYFNRIQSEHVFQSLTESNKPGTAHRTGIYLTPVDKRGDESHFRLLRCSTNLSGPTENFRATDWHVVDALNREAEEIFSGHAPLNHALAQIYRNAPASESQKQTKAKIKTHADKTKDMPTNGVMAFCTFYDQIEKLQPSKDDAFDFVHKRTSGLTRLHFRLKPCAAERPGCELPHQFSITLYPNSVFMMPLSTNRLYTHETRPSQLDAERMPTRMGYVVRCSSTESVHQEGETFLKRKGELLKLAAPTSDGMAELRKLYAEENKSDSLIDYGNKFLFSMNSGDYAEPGYRLTDEFRKYQLPSDVNPFTELLASVEFESVGKGRQGTVLVRPDESRGVPIVRTTTRYESPAQCFQPAHIRLANRIRRIASLPQSLNNALIEVYTNAYRKMGFHSDQALDLKDGSFVALFSCYQNPDETDSLRKLVIEPKGSESVTQEILLEHHSLVLFSVESNRRFKHKIVLANSNPRQENKWLGITFRQSKTFVRVENQDAYFEDGTPLTLANEDQKREFFSLRGRENKETDFTYPHVSFTISESDLQAPKEH